MNYLLLIFLLLNPNTYESNNTINKKENNDNLILQNAIKEVIKNIELPSYSNTYELKDSNSGYNIATVTIEMDALFSNEEKHVFINIKEPIEHATNIYIYHVTNNELKLLLNKEIFMSAAGYSNKEYMDVNGDGHRDFLFCSESGSGCCPRVSYDVFLYKPNSNFIGPFEFMNPTFSLEDNIVRGIDYGYPESIGLYKYQWHEFSLKSVEFIYHNIDYINKKNKKSFIKTQNSIYQPTEKDGIVLQEVPTEYHYINSYNWFINL